MPPRHLLSLVVTALAFVPAIAAGCRCSGGHEEQPDAALDAGPVGISQAPPLESAPAPAPPPPGSVEPAPPTPALVCPKGMMAVGGKFCVDKWEASLIDKNTQLPISPHYPPDRRLAAKLADTWDKERLELGSEAARQMSLPPLPTWERQREIEPVALSRPGVIPNGYLSGDMAERACRNAGKRLCHYEEWITACKGEAKRQFPYGDEYKQGSCNIFRALHPAKELHDNAAIGHLDPRLGLVKEKNGDPLLRRTGATRACKSEWDGDAAWDMNGNLDEWVDDEKGRFVGGFFSRSKKDGCESSITAHPRAYLDYSTGTRCCWDPGDGDPPR